MLKEKLASGEHHLEAFCGKDTLKQDIVVFTLKDKQPATTTHDWFYCSATRFPNDGSPVYIQAGASDRGTQLYYSIFSGEKEIESGTKTINNNVFTRALTYDATMGDGITVTMAWVVDGKLYSHQAQIARPMPDTKLRTAWKTFRDKLTPGQKETWTLRVLSPQDKPAQAQLMATMYDKSLDALRANVWQLNNSFYFPTPGVSWNELFLGNLWLSGSQSVKSVNSSPLSFTRFDASLFYWNYLPRYKMVRNRVMDAAAPEVMMSKALSNEGVMKLDEEAVVSRVMDAQEASDEVASSSANPEIQLRENLAETAFFYPASQRIKTGT